MLELDFNFARDKFHMQICMKIGAPITGILGASGSGKTTFLAIIAGILRPQTGYISLNDRVLFSCDSSKPSVWKPPHQRGIGLVFQDGQLFPHLSVYKNLVYGFQNIPAEKRQFNPIEIAELLEIDQLFERRINTLSGGEKQRVALGRAVLYCPELLLLDEPLSALDERLKNQILPFFSRIKSQCHIPMIYVTHSPHELDFLTDCQLVMKDGELKTQGN